MAAPSNIPGLRKLSRKGGEVAWLWVASQVTRHSKGFKPRTRCLWRGVSEPSREQVAAIAQECAVLTGNLRAWQTTGRMPKPKSARIGMVYFLANEENFIKIGFTTDVRRRLTTLQVGSASHQRLLGTMVGTSRMEGDIKHRFRRLRVRGEWFRPEKLLLDFIAEETRTEEKAA